MKKALIVQFVIVCLMLIFGVCPASAIEDLKIKSLRVDGDLTFNFIAHKLQSCWAVDDAGLAYIFHQDTGAVNAWSYQGGQALNLNIAFRPSKCWYMSLGLLGIGNYADRFWLPINDEHRLKSEGQKMKWTKGEVAYRTDRLKISLFGGIGHYHWEEEGDLFQLYPEQFDIDNYRRISGRPIPRGLNIKYYSPWGKLELAHGAELVWGDRTSTYGKYTWRMGSFNNAFIFKDSRIDWGKEPKEPLRAYEFTSRVDLTDAFPMQFGVLYQPFRSDNQPYEFVEVTASDTNIYVIPNSTNTISTGKLNIKNGTTNQSDALGYKGRIGCTIIPYINEIAFGYANQGLTAGNKQEYSAELTKEFHSYFKMDFLGVYRKPIIGPLPYLYEGTVNNPLTKVIGPRARKDAFWVTNDNRQGHIYKLTFNFDPTPASRFYFWQPNILEEWNLNPGEDSTFALALQYLARKYTTTTDAWYYRNRDNLLLWDGEYDPTKEFWDYRPAGKWPLKDWIHSFNTMIRLIPASTYRFWINLRWGQDIATGNLAYTVKTNENKPITNFFLGTVWLEKKPYRASVTYGKDVWGPEEWQQRFGGTIDRLYKFSLSRLWSNRPFFGTDSTLGIEYVGCREKDNLYLYPEFGAFNEWRLFYNLHFGSRFVYRDEEKPKPREAAPLPPVVELRILTPLFIPKSEEVPAAVFGITAKDKKGFKSWELNINDEQGNLVQTFRGDGHPPSNLLWDGTDLALGEIAPEGEYQILFKATNMVDLTTETDPQTITLKLPQIQVVKEILQEAPIEVKEEERGVVMNIISTVLFDFDKYALKDEALPVLDRVTEVLKKYPRNKVRIEGHTDSIGTMAYNQKLSERRALIVYKYLIQQDTAKEQIETFGYGETKPKVTNRTAEGRAINRRVEIVILKDTME